MPEYLTAEQIAAELGVHIQTVQRWFRTGSLPGRKITRSWTTTRDAFDRWMLGQPPAGADKGYGPEPPTGLDLETKA